MTANEFKTRIERCHTAGELMTLFNAHWAELVGARAELMTLFALWCARRELLLEDRAAIGTRGGAFVPACAA